jgi:hypothetical protein
LIELPNDIANESVSVRKLDFSWTIGVLVVISTMNGLLGELEGPDLHTPIVVAYLAFVGQIAIKKVSENKILLLLVIFGEYLHLPHASGHVLASRQVPAVSPEIVATRPPSIVLDKSKHLKNYLTWTKILVASLSSSFA